MKILLYGVYSQIFYFFSFSILVYIIHGYLQDTTNQFKRPHKIGRFSLPSWMMTLMMVGLILTELVATAIFSYRNNFFYFWMYKNG